MHDFELLLLIVNKGHASGALRIAKRNGILGGTILFARGTINSKLLEFLELSDIWRELVFMVAERGAASAAIAALKKELALHKPGHGILVTLSISEYLGAIGQEFHQDVEGDAMSERTYRAIFTVVDQGQAENVVDAAKAAGARGGTIIHARGSGIHETEVLFAMPIEPEKEVVLIIAAPDISANVIGSIRANLHMDEAGRGVMFVLDINEAHGLY